MHIQINQVEASEVASARELYRQEANCQVVRDSLLSRGLADAYLILVDGRRAGYGAIRNKYDPGRLMEFYTLPYVRDHAQTLFRELSGVSQATSMEAQTNMPLMLTMFYDCACEITTESILFHDASVTHLECADGIFRHSTPQDAESAFEHQAEPVGEWVIESSGALVATGGFLCHYNPPYGDIFMEVVATARRQGFGSYLVQEVKRVCYEAGKKPAARCSPTNAASRAALQKAGFLPCGRLLVGQLRTEGEG